MVHERTVAFAIVKERAIFLAELAAGMATPEWKSWAVARLSAD
jgi:hypothetical protein